MRDMRTVSNISSLSSLSSASSARAPDEVPAAPAAPPLRRANSLPLLRPQDARGARLDQPAALPMPQMQRTLLAQIQAGAATSAQDRPAPSSDPASERQLLHRKLLAKATSNALRFAESLSDRGAPPGIYAMRGNTAVGKTRFVHSAMPVVGQALHSADGACVNPDLFKPPLRAQGASQLSSRQVHAESCVLADALEARLRDMKTADGAPASMLIDKRLAYDGEIGRYSAMAQQTGRKMVLCDVDADLEQSLAGVLERPPGGADPLPPFLVVGAGFSAVRSQRLAVIDRFIAQPALGSYQLHGTAPDGQKIKVASVEQGILTIHAPELYAQVTAAPSQRVGQISRQVIDEARIAELTSTLGAERRPVAAAALRPYLGMSWQQALDLHSTLAA